MNKPIEDITPRESLGVIGIFILNFDLYVLIRENNFKIYSKPTTKNFWRTT